MLDSPGVILSLCALAFLAGMINSVAGGGTLLTFPALMAALASFGPEAGVVANATSTLALVPGSLAGAWGYRKQIRPGKQWLILLFAPSLVGGVIGALLLTRFPDYFNQLIPWLLLAAALLFLVDTVTAKKATGADEATRLPAGWLALTWLVLFQLTVSVYGGYFGAGCGILMLSSLTMMHVGDMHEMNTIKTILAGCINGIAVIVFIAEGKISWPHALPMAVAAVAGGYLGARLALRLKPGWVRWGVIIIGFGLAGYYFLK